MAAGEEKVEAIRASDLMKLMKVVEMATGLWNEIEKAHSETWTCELETWGQLGDALRDLGLAEVKP
jgi:hypothetical protein